MRVLLLNAPHPGIGSRIPDEHLPPLHLLAVGGPLLDAGHEVRLLDADYDPLTLPQILTQVQAFGPDAILLGHSGSSSGHPIIVEISRALRGLLPGVPLIYGGVFPTFHWQNVLTQEPQLDVIVRGEGEATAPRVLKALELSTPLDEIPGIAFRKEGQPYATPPAEPIEDLDAFRIGWELVDLSRYTYWGNRRAVVVQFSRGCPHVCSYCGQRAFWVRWRHRDPRKFAAEIAWLYRTHGVEVFDLADENPTVSKSVWKEFLEAMIAENIPVTIIGSTRADAIVRDADILHLYKKAGITRWLLGIENYDEATLKNIRKGGSPSTDRQAIQLLRQHNIISMGTWVVGFAEEAPRDYLHGLGNCSAMTPTRSRSSMPRLTAGPPSSSWNHSVKSFKPTSVSGTTSIKSWPRAIWPPGMLCSGSRSSKPSCNCARAPSGESWLIRTPPSVPECAGTTSLAAACGSMRSSTSSSVTSTPATAPDSLNSGRPAPG